MASIRQLKNKINSFGDFKKVVNIQKIVVMKEIAEQKKIIEQLNFRDKIYNNLLVDLHKKHGSFEPGFFDEKKSKVPIKRNLHFIMANSSSNVGIYSNNLLLEFAEKNHTPDDIYIIFGRDLGKKFKQSHKNVMNILPEISNKDNIAYENIASQVLRGYKDLLFISSSFIFFDLSTRSVEKMKIFPFEKKKSKISEEIKSKNFDLENKIFESIKMRKTIWIRDLDSISEKIAKYAIRGKTYYIMTKYKLDSMLRELQALDDKEKNIIEEIEKIKLQIQRVRQEAVTNELLTNSVAFGALNEKGDD